MCMLIYMNHMTTAVIRNLNRCFLFCTDAPLTISNLMSAVSPVAKWKEFCWSLLIEVKPTFTSSLNDKQDTMECFLNAPYCQASWQTVALALYHRMEERALDNLFHYVKSPAGKYM